MEKMYRVGTDCSGMDSAMVATEARLGIDVDQVFCSDIYAPAVDILKANKGASCKIFGDITSRKMEEMDAFKNIDLYVFTPPAKIIQV